MFVEYIRRYHNINLIGNAHNSGNFKFENRYIH